MEKWHVTPAGKAARCHAKIRCRLSGEELHGSSREEALKLYEQNLSKAHKPLPKAKKRLSPNERPRPLSKVKDKKLPVSPSEIEVPHDPNAHYAVLSDVDGTLTRGSLVLEHATYLHEKGIIDLGDLPQKWKADPKNEHLIMELAEAYRDQIAGHKVEDLRVDEFLDGYEKEEGKFYSTLGQLREFKRRGWEVQLISGSPDFLVEPFAARNGFYGKGSEYFKGEDGKLTGSISGMFGHEAKEGYIQKLNVSRFKRILAFGDTASDVPLFNNAHHSTLVDPSEDTAAKVKASIITRD